MEGIGMPQVPFKGKHKADLFMEPDEFRMLLAVTAEDREALRLFVALGVVGLRTIEAEWLKVKSVDEAKGGLWVTTAKKKKRPLEFVQLDGQTLGVLAEAAGGRDPNEPLLLWRGKPFTKRRIRYAFHKYKRRAGIRPVLGPHSLRHLAGIVLTEGGAMPQEVANYLRQTGLGQVMVYSNLRAERARVLAKGAAQTLLSGLPGKARHLRM